MPPSTSSSGPPLSAARTFLFWALAAVWFTEMLFLGIEPLSRVWTQLWQVVPPEDPRLFADLYLTWVVAAPAKAALCVMAVFGLRSRSPAVRTALFVAMASVPPLNIAFPFRQQGFLPGPLAVATLLSAILWGSFLLFREPSSEPTATEGTERRGTGAASFTSRGDVARRGWLAVSSVTLTLLAGLLLFRTRTALDLLLPWEAASMAGHETDLLSLLHTAMAAGTHLLAVAIASWVATIEYRRLPALQAPVAAASAVLAGLMLVLPLRRMALQAGAGAASASVLVAFAPLFVGWLLFLASPRASRESRAAASPTRMTFRHRMTGP